MKQNITLIITALIAFMLGAGFNNRAVSDVNPDYKIAVVDVNKVVQKSTKVQALKKEQNQKMSELKTWLTNAREEVAKQKTEDERKNSQKNTNRNLTKNNPKSKKIMRQNFRKSIKT